MVNLSIKEETTPGAYTSRLENVAPHNLGYQAIDKDCDIAEPLSPRPAATLPPPSSLLQPPPPLLTQAGRPRRNYRLPAHYEDINPKPLQPLKEEDGQPTAVLAHLHLIVRNQLRTTTNSFGLLQEYLYRPSFDPDFFVPDKDLH